jgi:uncharacterized protein with HEPN domain
MAYRSLPVWLEDMLITIQQIEGMTAVANNYQEYIQNQMLVLATERGLEIIAEALKNADKQEPQLPISNKRKIINLKNIINHFYFEIDNENIWKILKNDLPTLKEEIIKILDDYERKLELNEL